MRNSCNYSVFAPERSYELSATCVAIAEGTIGVSYAIFLLCQRSMETSRSQWVLESNSNRGPRDRPSSFAT